MTDADRAALKALVDKWEKEANCYVGGAMLPTPVGEMNRASATVTRRILADLSALIAAGLSEA